jgi:hypothetical protein
MADQRGQGTLEYLAVVLLVALVLGGTGTAVASATGANVASSVTREIRRAICIVSGGECDRDLAPCETGSTVDRDGWKATVAIVRIGRDRVVIRRKMSDGSQVVTVMKDWTVGAESIEGAKLKVDRAARRGISIGGTLTQSIVATHGGGRTWVLDGKEEADRLVAALRRDEDSVRKPDQRLGEGSLGAGVATSRSANKAYVGGVGSAGVSGEITAGRSTDDRTGASTYFLEQGADVVLALSAGLGPLQASASADGSGSARIAVTRDRDGRWTDLTLVGTGEVGGEVTLPPKLGPVAEALAVPTVGARRWIAEAHLDLSDGASRDAAMALVHALGAFPPRPEAVTAAARSLARRIDDHAVIDLRAYELDRTSEGLDVAVGEGVGVGFATTDATERARLIAATTRGQDGQWHRRVECTKEKGT